MTNNLITLIIGTHNDFICVLFNQDRMKKIFIKPKNKLNHAVFTDIYEKWNVYNIYIYRMQYFVQFE